MLSLMRVLIVTTLMSVLLGMAVPSPAGTWRGKLHGRPGLDLRLAGVPNHLRGTAVLYVLRRDGEISKEEMPVRNGRFDGRTVSFEIRPHFEPPRTIECEMTLTSANTAEVAVAGDPRDPPMRLTMVRVP